MEVLAEALVVVSVLTLVGAILLGSIILAGFAVITLLLSWSFALDVRASERDKW